MNKSEFWTYISLLDRDRIDEEPDDDGDHPVTAPLIDALSHLPSDEITAFDDILSELLYDLDGQAYAMHAGVCGEFEDLFLYCRCCAVASGRPAYDAILTDPSLMPDGMEFEPLMNVAERAWRKRTGSEYTHEPAFSLEMGANETNWPDR